MSTEYIRSKLAERGATRGAKFMKDGFDMWAESEAPAREGQMSKMPAESYDSYGGAMTVHHAKMLHSRAVDAGMQVAMNKRAVDAGMVLHGGGPLSDAVDAAKKILNFWREASTWIDNFDEELDYSILRDPKRSPSLKQFAQQLRDVIAGIRTQKAMLDGVATLAGVAGFGKHKMRGGMSFEEAGKYISKIMSWFTFLYKSYNNVMAILQLEAFKDVKPHIINAFNMIKSAVGLGKHCDCHSSGGRSRSKMVLTPRISGGASEFELYVDKELAGGMSASNTAKKLMTQFGLSLDEAIEYIKKHTIKKGGAFFDELGQHFQSQPQKTGFHPGEGVSGIIQGPSRGTMHPKGPKAYESCDAGWIDDGLLCRKPINCGNTMLNGFPSYTCNGGEVVAKKMKQGGRRGGTSHTQKLAFAKKMGYDESMIGLGSGGAFFDELGQHFQSQPQKTGFQPGDGVSGIIQGPSYGTMHPMSPRMDSIQGGPGYGIMDSVRKMGGRAPSARGAIVKQIMAQHGLSLPQASKFVKEHGLY